MPRVHVSSIISGSFIWNQKCFVQKAHTKKKGTMFLIPFFLRRAGLKKIEHVCYAMFSFPNKWDLYSIINNDPLQTCEGYRQIQIRF